MQASRMQPWPRVGRQGWAVNTSGSSSTTSSEAATAAAARSGTEQQHRQAARSHLREAAAQKRHDFVQQRGAAAAAAERAQLAHAGLQQTGPAGSGSGGGAAQAAAASHAWLVTLCHLHSYLAGPRLVIHGVPAAVAQLLSDEVQKASRGQQAGMQLAAARRGGAGRGVGLGRGWQGLRAAVQASRGTVRLYRLAAAPRCTVSGTHSPEHCLAQQHDNIVLCIPPGAASQSIGWHQIRAGP